MIKGKEVLMGITGGIAAYKAAELVRLLVKRKADVTVIMTAAAQEFIAPLTLETLSGNHVYTEMFESRRLPGINHISLADKADVLVIAPATANIIGKIAAGIADDLLSTVVMATKAPVIIAPAMNVNMWENPIVQRNIDFIKSHGIRIADPEAGYLACGWEGQGRMAELETIVEEVELTFTPQDLAGKKVLITAGPTREHIDPVRFLSNPSTGKMGFALARVARLMGAQVSLIHGPTYLAPPKGVEAVVVVSAAEMAAEVERRFSDRDIVIKAAAVGDFRPTTMQPHKIKKTDTESELTLELQRTPDILSGLGKQKKRQFLVGFAAETKDLIQNAHQKLKSKNLDMIVANDVTRPDSGFASETNEVKIITEDGKIKDFPLMSKEDAAREILLAIVAQMQAGKPNDG